MLLYVHGGGCICLCILAVFHFIVYTLVYTSMAFLNPDTTSMYVVVRSMAIPITASYRISELSMTASTCRHRGLICILLFDLFNHHNEL